MSVKKMMCWLQEFGNKRIFPLLFLLFTFSLFGAVHIVPEKVNYCLSKEAIDVVIPCTEKDLATLNLCIEGIRKNCSNIRRIIVVSQKQYTQSAEWFDEKLFPFSKFDLALQIFGDAVQAQKFVQAPNSRIGWIYQQLLKLYAPCIIPKISSNVLILMLTLFFYIALNL